MVMKLLSRIVDIGLGIVEDVLATRRRKREEQDAAVARLEEELENLGRVAKPVPEWVDRQLKKLDP
jgi:hypothetical protein